MTLRRYLIVAAAGVIGVWGWGVLSVNSAFSADATGVYSAEQAARGNTLYSARCASCHGDRLEGGDVAPPLAGAGFLDNWRGQSAADLASRIRVTMPLDNPGSLGMGASLDVMAYVLKINRFDAGASELPRDAASLKKIPIGVASP
jgi:cytochrome c